MKNILRFTLLGVSALLMLTSCEKEETNHGKAPDSIGSISLNRTRIGTGQQVTATCPLPTGGNNISSVEYRWKSTQNGLTQEGQQSETQSSFSFTAPSTPGQYELTFSALYIFNAPDKDGNAYKELTSTKTYTVEACDAVTSFWGDNLEVTLLDRPSLQQMDANTYGGQFPDQFSLNTLNPPLIPTMYTFTDGALSQIMEMETFSTTQDVYYIKKYLSLRQMISRLLGVAPSRETVTWENEQSSEAFNPEGDETYQNTIGAAISNHEVSIVSIFHGTKTDMRLEVFTSSTDGTSIEYMRTYQPAGTMQ